MGNCISLYNCISIITVGEIHGFKNNSSRATTQYYLDGGERNQRDKVISDQEGAFEKFAKADSISNVSSDT